MNGGTIKRIRNEEVVINGTGKYVGGIIGNMHSSAARSGYFTMDNANLALLENAGVTATEAKVSKLKNLCQALLNFSKVAADYFIEIEKSAQS